MEIAIDPADVNAPLFVRALARLVVQLNARQRADFAEHVTELDAEVG